MKVLQVDSKTIKIEKDGFSFRVSYSFVWNEIERKPESINLDGNTVNAFFLTSVIKDLIIEEEQGFTIKRTWKIIPTDKIALPFSLEIPMDGDTSFLFPCIHNGERLSMNKIAFMGERLSYPSSVFMFTGKSGIFIYTDPPSSKDDQSSIAVWKIKQKILKVDINFPPIEILPEPINTIPEYKSGLSVNSYNSNGNMIKENKFSILLCPERNLLPQALTCVRDRFIKERTRSPQQIKADAIKNIKEGIQKCLAELIVEDKGVFGLLPYTKAPFISAMASIGISVLIQKVYNFDSIRHEISLKLADFILKGQHPNGIFYTNFSIAHKKWYGEKIPEKSKSKDVQSDYYTISLPESGSVVNWLISFANLLEEKNIQNQKYFFAAKRFMESLFDSKKKLIEIGSKILPDSLKTIEKNLSCLELIFPLKEFYLATESEMYKKAITNLKSDFFPATLPPYFKLIQMDDTAYPSFEAVLLLLKSAIALEEQGINIREKEPLVHRVLPWLYYNNTATGTGCTTTAGILDSFDKCRLRSQGYELAYYLLKIKSILDSRELIKLIDEVILDLLDFAAQTPIGAPFIYHTAWMPDIDPKRAKDCSREFHSLVFIKESNFLLQLLSEFPDFFK
ncbi:MAG: hypothetical protein JW969_02695 [Spirochaetales bacterium]|nr:hypothetical protein [Spirochaetales bacterium]